MSKKSIIIAGGGTGGHVYPALAIANAVNKSNPEIEIHFVGTSRGIETRIIPKTQFKLSLVSMGRFNNISFFERLKTLFTLPLAFLQSLIILFKVRPAVVLGVGGYASIPVVMVASIFKVPTYIWEPNAYPGMANRLLSKFAKYVLVVFEESKQHLKGQNLEVVGLPVREDIESIKTVQNGPGFNILVFGGSLGARGINAVISQAILENTNWLEGVNWVHQTGKLDYKKISSQYQNKGSKVDCREYLDDMPAQYSKADLVICRAGASTVAELAACGKPSLLVPFPGAADDHQKKNAENLQNHGAAIMCEQTNFSVDYLREVITELKVQPQRLKQMSEKVKLFHVPNAAQQIARKLESHVSAE